MASDSYELASGITLNEIDGKTFLFSENSGDSYGLNDSGAELLELLIESGFEAAVSKSTEIFFWVVLTIRVDWREWVDDLVAAKLLRKT